MAIVTPNPILDDDGNYDKLGINLAVSPMWRDDSIGCSVAMRLTPPISPQSTATAYRI